MKKLKKINRGIVLGIILFIIMTIYIIIGNIRFQKEKPLIEETIRNYISDFDHLNITPEEYRSSDKNLCREFEADYSERLSSVADRYWTIDQSFHHVYRWAVSKSQLCSSTNSLNRYTGNYTTDFSSSASDFIIIRDSVQTAVVVCKVSSIYKGHISSADNEMKNYYSSELLYLISPAGDNLYQFDAHINDDTISSDLEITVTFTLKRTNDGWKILYCSSDFL